jgi:cytochrome c553
MPSDALRNLSDSDVQAIVAWMRSLPAEREPTPPNRFNVLGAILLSRVPLFRAQPPITEPVPDPPRKPVGRYGDYLSSIACEGCHGADLLGNDEIGSPPLIAVAKAWNEKQFIEFMRTGIRPDGTGVNEEGMPWEELSALLRDDEDLQAIYAFLKER